MNEFKDMLSYFRKSYGLSQRELADRIHVTPGAIGMYESGKRYPTREVEEAIADFFNVNLNTLRGISEIDEKYNAESAHLLTAINNDEMLKDFIKMFIRLTDEQKASVATIVRSMLPNR